MSGLPLAFSPNSSQESGSFRLLELPLELCKLIEAGKDDISLFIKGSANEDAVLCTTDKTYAIRSLSLSNSVLVVSPAAKDSQLLIRDQKHEILELLPSVPKLHQLRTLLRGREYDEGHEDEDETMSDDGGETQLRASKKTRLSYEDALAQIQASEKEILKGIKDQRILFIKGYLRPIALSYLTTILELLLNALVSLSQSHESASVEELTSALEDDHEIKREVTTQVMTWFGDISLGKWEMNVEGVLKQVGLGILRAYRADPIREPEFMKKWANAVGDTFASRLSLNLLSGNYLVSTSPHLQDEAPQLMYFPYTELPIDPAARFSELFLMRSRWKAQEITPFLDDISVNTKERDKLLLKFARALTDSGVVFYTARTR